MTVDSTIRTFICIDLPQAIKERIDRLEDSLRKTDAQVSWVKSRNIHITIKFLGAIERSRLERVNEIVRRAAAAVEPFEVEVASTGCFPSVRNPRVLWVGLSGTPQPMIDLYDEIEDRLANEGFDREKRPFAPHLTIGRLRSPRNGEQLARQLIDRGFEAERFTAREIIVMRSDLRPTGSIYTPQLVAPLGGERPEA